MKREFLQSLKINEAELPKQIIDAIMAENGKDIQAARTASQEWEDKYNQAQKAHAEQIAHMQFQSSLERAVQEAKGRNAKAISALLDTEAIKASENQQEALKQAIGELKNAHGYLFEQEVPPPYARGTGTHSPAGKEYPATLAGALKERFERK